MKSKLPLFLIAAAMLASCGGNSSSSQQSGSSTETSQAPESAVYLDWVADNKIVIELFDAPEGAHFTYGNAALQATNTLDLSASAAIGFSGEFTSEQVFNFVYVTEVRAGDGHGSLGVTAAALYRAIEGDKVSEFLRGADDLQGKTRAYVAISYGSTVKWTKDKNAAMDAKIQQLVDAA